MLHSDISAASAVKAVKAVKIRARNKELTMQLFIAKISCAAASQLIGSVISLPLFAV